MKVQPVLYDLKRGLLRLSTLTLFVLFLALGIGLGYLTYTNMSTSYSGLGEQVIVVKADLEKGEVWINALSFVQPDMEVSTELSYKIMCYNHTELVSRTAEGPVSIEEFAEKHGLLISEGSARFKGLLNHRETIEKLDVRLGDYKYGDFVSDFQCILRYDIASPFMKLSSSGHLHIAIKESGGVVLHGIITPTRYLTATLIDSVSFGPLVGTRVYDGLVAVRFSPILKDRSDVVLVGAINLPLFEDLAVELYVKPNEESVGVAPPISASHPEDPEAAGFTRVATVGNGVFLVRFNLADVGYLNGLPNSFDLLFKLKSGSYENKVLVRIGHRLERAQNLVERVTTFALITSLGAYEILFPIAILYLPYIYIAKPRSQGALEFLVARPITRFDLYFTRYFAGLLVVVITAALFVVSTHQAIAFLLNVRIELAVVLLLFAGITFSVMAFYSICYFIASAVKGSNYIIVAIIAYLFFTVFIRVILSIITVHIGSYGDYSKLEYLSWYFNPFGVSFLSNHYALRYYEIGPGEPELIEQVVSPHLIALSTALWITVPAILGWLLFRRANLSG